MVSLHHKRKGSKSIKPPHARIHDCTLNAARSLQWKMRSVKRITLRCAYGQNIWPRDVVPSGRFSLRSLSRHDSFDWKYCQRGYRKACDFRGKQLFSSNICATATRTETVDGVPRKKRKMDAGKLNISFCWHRRQNVFAHFDFDWAPLLKSNQFCQLIVLLSFRLLPEMFAS